MPYRLYQLAEDPKVDATWQNLDGSATIYISDDPSANDITLTIVNKLEAPVMFPPGSPAAIGAVPPGQCAIYLFLNGLLSNEQVGAITAAESPWASAVFTDTTTGQAYLAMAPGEQIVLNVGEAVELRLAGVTASGQPASGYVDAFLVGVRDVEDGARVQAYVTVTHPPAPGNKELRLLVGFAEGDMVFTGTGHPNRLLLFLTNPGDEPLVPGGSDSWGRDDPVFRFSVTCGKGPGALTTVELGRSIEFGIDAAYGNVWGWTRDDQGDHPRWLLKPDRKDSGNVLGTGERSTIVFDIHNIVTTLPQGVTYAHIGYQNIPGYNDGYFALEIIKVEPIVIESFTATPAAITDAVNALQVTLRFAVRNAAYVTILNTSYASQASRFRFEDTAVVMISATTTFTLLAQNLATGQQYAQALTVPFSPDQFHVLPVGTIVMWSGTRETIPIGWALCDGQYGRPDLINRFALGTGPGGSHKSGEKGGAEIHKHDASGIVGVFVAGEHAHRPPPAWYKHEIQWIRDGDMSFVDCRREKVETSYTTREGRHSHDAQATIKVEDATTLPPWYALCYIIKIV